MFRGRRGKKSLGVARHVAVRHIAVLDLEEDFAGGAHQDRAERMIAVAAGALRHCERAAQERLVIKRRHDGVHFPGH